MTDDVPLTWLELPPAPAGSRSVHRAASQAAAHLRDGGAVTLTGEDGSGRRTAALTAAADLGPNAFVVPGVPWRAPEAYRDIARRLDARMPPELRPQMVVKLAQAALAEHPGGLIIVDARLQADPGLLGALRPPPGWRAMLLAPHGIDADTAWGPVIDLGTGTAPTPVDGDDAVVLAAASYFDPWEGAPRALLPAVADRPEAATSAAIDRLLDAGRLRPAGDPRRVLPTLHDYQARPEVTDPRERPLAERYVAVMATLCGRTARADARNLGTDRANIMTALSVWPAVAPPGLVVGFAHALPMLLDDVACHEAAKAVISAGRFGDDAAQQLTADAQRRLEA